MPLYEYACGSCGARFERIRKFSDPPVTICPECGGTVEKLISSPAFHLKGSGWYITDYARSGQKDGGDKDAAAKEGAGKEGGAGKDTGKDSSDKGSAEKGASEKGGSGRDSGATSTSSDSSTSTKSEAPKSDSSAPAKPAASDSKK